MCCPASSEALLRAEIRAVDAQLDAGRTLQLGLASAVRRLTHSALHRRHASPGSAHRTAGRRQREGVEEKVGGAVTGLINGE